MAQMQCAYDYTISDPSVGRDKYDTPVPSNNLCQTCVRKETGIMRTNLKCTVERWTAEL